MSGERQGVASECSRRIPSEQSLPKDRRANIADTVTDHRTSLRLHVSIHSYQRQYDSRWLQKSVVLATISSLLSETREAFLELIQPLFSAHSAIVLRRHSLQLGGQQRDIPAAKRLAVVPIPPPIQVRDTG